MTKIASLSKKKQQFIRKLHQKKYRYQNKMYFCEGYKTLAMAILQKNIILNEIVITDSIFNVKNGRIIEKMAKEHNIDLYICDEKVMKKLSDEKTPANILFTVAMNNINLSKMESCYAANIVCLENISDPGNLGTIIRTSAWFGFNTIILTSGCVDPYNPKTIRSSAGAVLYSDIYIDADLKQVKNIFKARNYLFTATVPGEGITPDNWKISDKNLILLGSEANGLSKDALHNADLKLTIPGYGKIDSLNVSVAAGIIFYHLSQYTNLVKNNGNQ